MARMGAQSAITQFWSWWPTAVERLRPATDRVLLAEVDELVRRVEDIHPKIQVLGKFDPKGGSWLCLSSRGNLAIRPLVERWAAAAPKDDGWRYLCARPPAWPPKRAMPFPLEELEAFVEKDELCELAHVTLHHPAMGDVEDLHRDTLAFVALDHLLGEDAVERWVGNIETASGSPEGTVPITELRRLIDQLAEEATGKKWQAVRAGGKDNALLVSINRAIKPLDHLELPIHVRIDLTLQAPTKRGMVQSKEAVELDELQNELLRDLGTRAVAVARETYKGHRIIHLHASEDGAARIQTWRQKYPQWGTVVLTQHDPHWEVLRRWGDPGAELRTSSFPPINEPR